MAGNTVNTFFLVELIGFGLIGLIAVILSIGIAIDGIKESNRKHAKR
jgi:hypothetical protein